MNKGRKKFGLVEICDVCGKPLLKGQKLGKKVSNDALCHDDCLYYEIADKLVTRKKFREHIFQIKNLNRI